MLGTQRYLANLPITGLGRERKHRRKVWHKTSLLKSILNWICDYKTCCTLNNTAEEDFCPKELTSYV